MAVTHPYQPIAVAVRCLRVVCDGAKEPDAHGFQASDVAFGHGLAAMPVEDWTARETRDAYDMLRKYQQQLRSCGIRYEALPVPPRPAERPASSPRTRQKEKPPAGTVTLEGSLFVVAFSYNAALVQRIRSYPGPRRYDGQRRAWIVEVASKACVEALRVFIRECRFTVSSAAVERLHAIEDGASLSMSAGPAQSRRVISADGEAWTIQFEYNMGLSDQVKQLVPACRWDKTAKLWRVMATYTGAQGVARLKAAVPTFVLTEEARALVTRIEDAHRGLADLSRAAEVDDFEIKGLPDGLVPRPFQVAGVKYALRSKRVIIGDDMGLGKALAVETPVMTPHGWSTMGALRVGDSVFGPDGRPTTVVGVYPQGVRELFRVTFSDGASLLADADHLWQVQHVRNDHAGRYPRTGGRWRVMTTAQLVERGVCDSSGNRTWRIPLVQPIRFPTADLPVDPYVLGALLGDGGLTNRVLFSTSDAWMLTELHARVGDGIRIRRTGRSFDYRLAGPGPGIRNPLADKLTDLGVRCSAKRKRIPRTYMESDVDQRLLLLAGILDTDGHQRSDGHIEVTLASKGLCEDIVEVVRSLGQVARLHARRDGVTWRVSIAWGGEVSPFRLPRKANAFVVRTKYRPTRIIKSIEPERVGDAVCIAVAHESRLFVAGDYVVTHNTIQSLLAMRVADVFPFVVVCPSSVKLNWYREARTWLPPRTTISVIDGIKGKNAAYYADVIILNYDILARRLSADEKAAQRAAKQVGRKSTVSAAGPHVQALRKRGIKGIVFDECHSIKNLKAARTQAAAELAEGLEYRIGLSGTAITNRPYELVAQLRVLGRLDDLGGWRYFTRHYCDSGAGDLKGGKNLKQLNEQMRSVCYIRREKTDVLTELPEKTRALVSIEIDNRREYDKVAEDVIGWLRRKAGDEAADKAARAEQIVRINHLKRTAAFGMLKGGIAWVQNFLESDEKLILFAVHKEIQQALLKAFPSAVHIFGDDDTASRQRAVDKFQTDPTCKLIICSLAAAGVGWTGTAASNVAFFEFGWNPAIHDQAEDRSYRMGQKNAVTAWYLMADNTIYTNIWDLIEAKRGVVTETLTGGDSQEDTTSMLEGLVSDLAGRQSTLLV